MPRIAKPKVKFTMTAITKVAVKWRDAGEDQYMFECDHGTVAIYAGKAAFSWNMLPTGTVTAKEARAVCAKLVEAMFDDHKHPEYSSGNGFVTIKPGLILEI